MRSSLTLLTTKVVSIFCAATLTLGLVPAAAFAANDPVEDESSQAIISNEAAETDAAENSDAAASSAGAGLTPRDEEAEAEDNVQASDELNTDIPASTEDDSTGTNAVAGDGSNLAIPAVVERVNQDVALTTPVAQAESVRSYFLAQTLESTRTVPMVSANLPLDTGTGEGASDGAEGDNATEDEGGEDSDESDPAPGVIAAASTVVGSFTYEGMTFAIEAGGESVALVAVDYNQLPESFIQMQVIVIPEAVTPNGYDYYSVTRIADHAFASLTKENANPDYKGCEALFANEELLDEAGIDTAEVEAFLNPESDMIDIDGDGEADAPANPLKDCTGVLALGIPSSVTSIGDDAFAGFDTLQYLVDSEGNATYATFDGALYSADLTDLRLIPEGRVGAVRVAPSATTVEPEAFSHCAALTTVVADPESVAAEAITIGGAAPNNQNVILLRTDESSAVLPGGIANYLAAFAATCFAADIYRMGESVVSLSEASQYGFFYMKESFSVSGKGFVMAPESEATTCCTEKGCTSSVVTSSDVSKMTSLSATFTSGATVHKCPTSGFIVFSNWSHQHYYWVTINGVNYSYVELKAKFQKQYKITWDAAGGSKGIQETTVGQGDTFSVNVSPGTKEGYRFTGWKTSFDSITYQMGWPLQMPDKDITLTATWKINSYTITYDPNGGSVASTSEDAEYSSIYYVHGYHGTKQGYRFDYWIPDVQIQENVSHYCDGWPLPVPARDVKLTAHWTPISYTISYDLAGGSVSTANKTSYTIETATFALTNPTRTGYTFTGWTGTGLSSASKSVSVEMGSIGNRSYTATWSADPYTISYDLAGGSVATANPTSYTVETDSFTLVNPTKTGYTFAGWTGTGLSSASTSVSVDKGSLGNRSYTATWKIDSYTITYDPNGGSGTPSPVVAEYGSIIDVNGDHGTKAGYTFAYWIPDQKTQDNAPYYCSGWPLTVPARNVKLTAHWTPVSYTISYDLAEGSVSTANPTSYTVESDTFALTNPTRTGYTFAGWTGTGLSSASTSVSVAKGSIGNRSYLATWSADSYTISYDLAGGSVSTANPTSYTAETDSFTLVNPTKTGYTFAGWTGTGLSSASTSVSVDKGSLGNRSYIATWKINSYTITYDSNGGSVDSTSEDAEYKSVYQVRGYHGTKQGYRFDYWIPDVQIQENVSHYCDGWPLPVPARDVKLTAHWTPISYTISYDLAGGSVVTENPTSYDIETATFSLVNPTKTGCVFAGWTGTDLSSASASVTVETGSTGNRSYTATWSPKSYTITYDPNGGSVTSTSEDAEYSSIYQVRGYHGTKQGYRFDYWVPDQKTQDNAPYYCDGWPLTVPARDVKLTAHWTPISYTISYDLAGGSVATENPTSYTVETDSFALVNPTKTGYTFTGWTGTGLSSASKSVSVEMGSIGNRSYTATWSADPYTITFSADEGTYDKTDPIDVYYGFDMSGVSGYTASFPGYTFKGWADDAGALYIDGEGNGCAVLFGMDTTLANVTLHPVWEQRNYTITWVFDWNYKEADGTVIYSWDHERRPGDASFEDGRIEKKDIKYGDAATIPAPMTAYYDFNGWYQGKWEALTHAGIDDVEKGDLFVKKDDGTYSFEPSDYENVSDIVLFASWSTTPHKYTVTLRTDGHGSSFSNGDITISPDCSYSKASSVVDIMDASCLPSATQAGWAFAGWVEEGASELYGSDTVPRGERDYVFDAKWVVSDTIYTITFDKGEEVKGQAPYSALDLVAMDPTVATRGFDAKGAKDGKPLAPPALEKYETCGYVFDGWYLAKRNASDRTKIEFASPLTKLEGDALTGQDLVDAAEAAKTTELIYMARWTPKTFEVHYRYRTDSTEEMGAPAYAPSKLTYEDTVTLQKPAFEQTGASGSIFRRWLGATSNPYGANGFEPGDSFTMRDLVNEAGEDCIVERTEEDASIVNEIWLSAEWIDKCSFTVPLYVTIVVDPDRPQGTKVIVGSETDSSAKGWIETDSTSEVIVESVAFERAEGEKGTAFALTAKGTDRSDAVRLTLLGDNPDEGTALPLKMRTDANAPYYGRIDGSGRTIGLSENGFGTFKAQDGAPGRINVAYDLELADPALTFRDFENLLSIKDSHEGDGTRTAYDIGRVFYTLSKARS